MAKYQVSVQFDVEDGELWEEQRGFIELCEGVGWWTVVQPEVWLKSIVKQIVIRGETYSSIRVLVEGKEQ